MPSPHDRDRVDDWLTAEVEPLAPPPGTFERIRHRARRRKAGQAMTSAAGIAIVIAAAVTVPRIASTIAPSHHGPQQSVAEGHSSHRRTAGHHAKPRTTVPGATSSLSPGGSGNPVPRNFQPTSVTFVGPGTGAVIGQAGTPGHCATVYCTSLAGTFDYGSTWYGVSAPLAGPPRGSSGVSQLRFLNARDGWAFGPALFGTHDGGAHWSREPTSGMRVTDLETAGDRAFAIFASCTGTGANYAAGCTSFALYSSPAGSNDWQPVPVPAGSMQPPGTAAGPPGSASLVLTGGAGGTGYLLAPSGELLSGPLTGAGWTVASPPVARQHIRCLPGAPGASGQSSGTLLAADSRLVVLVCTAVVSRSGDQQAKLVVESADGGAHWTPVATAPAAGIAASLAIQAQDKLVVLATDAGIYRSADGGRTWQLAQPSPGAAAPAERGFSFVGMTSPVQGVALPADPGLHEVFITRDGGRTWQPHAVSPP
jgi:photosystem II stability/assembly factor-like uncharacterized protein